MPSITVSRTIRAPIDRVFRSVADVREFAVIQPQIVNIEFLTQQQLGVGTQFRETRRMGKRTATTELQVIEFVENGRVRLLADAGGTIWDTVFSVAASAEPGTTELTMQMDARAHTLLARLMSPLIMGMVRKAVIADLDRVKAHCEADR